MRIYLIRHGRQNSNLCNVNVPLSEAGKKQAELTGKRMKKYDIQVVYSSDLIRAEETADIINEHLNVNRIIDERFRESDFGELTGLEDAVLKSKYKDFLQKRAEMTQDVAYPGGENCRDVFTRANEAIKDVIASDYESVAIVTHGGVIRALSSGLTGAPHEKWLAYGRQLENCSITEFLYDEEKKTFHLERFNDYAHIEDYDELRRKHFSSGFFNAK